MSHRQLIDLSIKPLDVSGLLGYIEVPTKPGYDTFRFNYLKTELLRKYSEIDSTTDLRTPTLEKARAQEDSNRLINESGYRPLKGRNSLLRYARGFVVDTLGDFTYDVYKASRFSGGSSTSRKAMHGAPYFKFGTKRSPLDVTPEAYARASTVIKLTNVWGSVFRKTRLRIVTSNEVSTVPKDASIERTIAKEPDCNMMLQLALGAGIRDRLSLHGLNLDDSWRINQKLARAGSANGKYATVDFANASSSIADRVVWDLIPTDWYTELNACRSKKGLWPDSGLEVKWEQFSSMGNGFTFELETVIFLSLAAAVMQEQGITPRLGENLVVFGDDVIIPVSCYDRYQALCESMGFKVNDKKSFKRGFFRESCGGYYFNGQDVKPFRIKEPVDTLPRVIWLLNAIRKWSSIGPDGKIYPICDPRLHEMYKGVYRKYRKHFKHRLASFKRGRVQHTQVDITGGRDLNSSTAVVTPGPVRQLLQLCTTREPRFNRAAYCATLQGAWLRDCNRAIDGHENPILPTVPRKYPVSTAFELNGRKWVESSAGGQFALLKVDDSTGRFVSNRIGPWSAMPPCFPDEIRGT